MQGRQRRLLLSCERVVLRHLDDSTCKIHSHVLAEALESKCDEDRAGWQQARLPAAAFLQAPQKHVKVDIGELRPQKNEKLAHGARKREERANGMAWKLLRGGAVTKRRVRDEYCWREEPRVKRCVFIDKKHEGDGHDGRLGGWRGDAYVLIMSRGSAAECWKGAIPLTVFSRCPGRPLAAAPSAAECWARVCLLMLTVELGFQC